MPLNDDMNARVSVLEDWRKEHRDWMNEMREKLDSLTTYVRSQVMCKTPNKCIDIEKEVTELAQESKNAMKRIESLERWRVFISGIAATIGIIWLVLQVIIPWAISIAEIMG